MLSTTGLAAATPSNTGHVWFGQGCFWERQWAYVNIELDKKGPFQRSNASVSSRVGYAGSLKTGEDGLVCYANDADPSSSYEGLGHAETVHPTLLTLNQKKT